MNGFVVVVVLCPILQGVIGARGSPGAKGQKGGKVRGLLRRRSAAG